MLAINSILFPVDFSERCAALLPYVGDVAHHLNAAVTLLHVSGVPDIEIPIDALTPATKRLEDFGRSELGHLRVKRRVAEGDPAPVIAAEAESQGSDLVMMPTHGYGRLRRALLGSVAAKVLHDVRCPVLTVTHPETAQSPKNWKTVVCAIDTLSWETPALLRFSDEVASIFGVKLVVVTTVTPMEEYVMAAAAPEALNSLLEPVTEDLKALVKKANIEAETCIHTGQVSHAVRRACERTGADLLVIGRGGQEGEAGRLGSNAYAIVREAPCPVLSL